MTLRPDCTEACEASPTCLVCGQRKPPVGRSVPIEMANGYCGYHCDGYTEAPKPGHLWPGEIKRSKEDDGGE